MMNRNLISTTLTCFIAFLSVKMMEAQESTGPLKISIEQIARFENERLFPERATSLRDNGIELPFIDDFSRYSLPTNDPSIPLEWQMWTDSRARINSSLPLNPPTKGVATLEGLDETGYPYNFSNSEAQGIADMLTSCPIDLSGKTAEDSVKLIFYYQEGGLGDRPELGTSLSDSLYVEFLVPQSNPPNWLPVWSTLPTSTTEFQQVIIHIEDAFYFEPEFQFRFVNYGNLSANADHWHIDYVWLDENIVDSLFQIVDISATGNEASLLNGLRSMPWKHYQNAPSGYMRLNEQVQFSNLDEDRNISFGSSISYDGEIIADFNQGLNTALNGFSTFQQEFSINDGNPNTFAFPVDVADTCAQFDVSYWCNTSPDLNNINDTITFTQDFNNYYAYDDGSVETKYGVDLAGSSVALKYDNVLEDTLIGILFNFIPFEGDNSGSSFILRAWEDNNGQPGNELVENFTLNYPEYFQAGYDLFTYYAFDEPFEVPSGPFHVGYVQQEANGIQLGWDRSLNSSADNLHYTTGPFSPWFDSSISGSLMLRPVFKNGKELDWDFIDVDEINAPQINDLAVYPNPSSSQLFSQYLKVGQSISILNSVGVEVKNETLVVSEVDISDLAQGVYIIQVLSSNTLIGTSRFIKN